MSIEELKKEIEEQRKQNIELYNSIRWCPTHDDPLNKKAEPILAEWREGSKKLKGLIEELQELELDNKNKNKSITEEVNKTFVNGYGEATKRNITCNTYERTEKRNSKAILSFIGGR